MVTATAPLSCDCRVARVMIAGDGDALVASWFAGRLGTAQPSGVLDVLVRHDPATAVKVLAAASAVRARAGGAFQPIFQARADRVRTTAEAKLGGEVERLWTDGARLDVDQAAALAFGSPKRRPAPVEGLSEREIEVTRLVAEGLANKAIAARLHLSVRTVEVHVRHTLAKLGLQNRTQLATWARERVAK